MRTLGSWLAIGSGALLWAAAALADPVALTHTDWEMYHAGIVELTSTPDQHGARILYTVAPASPSPGSNWKRLTAAPGDPGNPVDIDFLGPNEDYSSELRTCLTEADFTYFETEVNVPLGFHVTTAQIAMGPLDDGARVVVINSKYPDGYTPDDGYLMLGDVKTIDLSALLQSGEANRIVVQHVDDCAAQAWLGTVELTVSGQAASARNTWGALKAKYR